MKFLEIKRKKWALSGILIASLMLSPALRADGSFLQEAVVVEEAPSPEDYPLEEVDLGSSIDSTDEVPLEQERPRGTAVGEGSHEGVRAAKAKQWQNIALAVGAVAVAVTALVLVAKN